MIILIIVIFVIIQNFNILFNTIQHHFGRIFDVYSEWGTLKIGEKIANTAVFLVKRCTMAVFRNQKVKSGYKV